MRCIQCGAELRPNARFCNVCGSDQALAQAVSQAEGQPAVIEPVPAAHFPFAQTGSEGEEVERVKRPPRVPRASDDEQEPSAASAPAATQPVEVAAIPTNGTAAPNVAKRGAESIGDLPW